MDHEISRTDRIVLPIGILATVLAALMLNGG